MFLSCEGPPASLVGSKVLFNGKELARCYAADDEGGWAAVYDEEDALTVVNGRIEFVFSSATLEAYPPAEIQVISKRQQLGCTKVKVKRGYEIIHLTIDGRVWKVPNRHDLSSVRRKR